MLTSKFKPQLDLEGEWHCTEKSDYCNLLIKEKLCIGNYFSSL